MPTENEEKWIAAWKFAGPELERIRNEELRQLDDETGTIIATTLGVHPSLLRPRQSNIGQLAAWFMKQHELELRER